MEANLEIEIRVFRFLFLFKKERRRERIWKSKFALFVFFFMKESKGGSEFGNGNPRHSFFFFL